MRSASLSAEPVGMAKYAVTVAVKSLIVTKGEEERERTRRKKKNSNHFFTVRLGDDTRRNDLPNHKFAPDRCVLVFPEK